MNKFKHLSGECVLCGEAVPGTAWGITPALAVCDEDWQKRRKTSERAIAKAVKAKAKAEGAS